MEELKLNKLTADNADNRPLVLIVDDEPTNISLLAQAIKDLCNLKVAGSAEQAFAILEAGIEPDLILLDIIMPGINGIEACRILRRDKKMIPIIFITARDKTENEIEGLEAGAIDYITKPFNPLLVRHRVNVHLNQIITEKILRINAEKLKRQRTALQKAEENSRALLEAVGNGIIGIDKNRLITFVNPAVSEILGNPKDSFVGRNVYTLIYNIYDDTQLDLPLECKVLAPLITGEICHGDDEIFWRIDGTSFPVDYYCAPIRQRREIIGAVLTFKDISERRKSAAEMRLAQAIFHNIQEGIVVTDRNANIIRINPAIEMISGYTSEELIDRPVNIWKSGRHKSDFFSQLWNGLQQNGFWKGEIWNRKKDGSIYPSYQTISSLEDESGNLYYVSLFSDISSKKALEDDLTYKANHDPLTALPNRQLFFDRLSRAIMYGKRSKASFALLFIDLDKFKFINDTMGHPAGDELLQLVAQRISSNLRESDTVARLGGDEFSVILNSIGNVKHAAFLAQQLIIKINESCQLKSGEAHVGASIGIAIFPNDGTTVEDLVSNADMAMFQAKQEGRNTYQFFTKELQSQTQEKMLIEHELSSSIVNNELTLEFQPVVNLISNKLVHLEALCRWQHPKRGLLYPNSFIPVAEESGFIHRLNMWLLDAAINQCCLWDQAGLPPLSLSLNIGTFQHHQGLSCSDVKKILTEKSFPGNRLVFELTEIAFMDDTEKAISWINGMKKLGVKIVIDDFGTGYSSLTLLSHLPIDFLKIDDTLIHRMEDNTNGLAFVKTICDMCRTLNINVIAKGVESKKQIELLVELNVACQLMQGNYIAKPVKPEYVPDFVHKNVNK